MTYSGLYEVYLSMCKGPTYPILIGLTKSDFEDLKSLVWDSMGTTNWKPWREEIVRSTSCRFHGATIVIARELENGFARFWLPKCRPIEARI